MTAAMRLQPFCPGPPDAAGVVSWVHIGDLHIMRAREQNHLDLIAIVEEINRSFKDSVAFVFVPGDVADDGSASAYAVVREALDRLAVPWCSILGDHDVREKSFDNYLRFMAAERYYSFAIGALRFVALNAFDLPDPGSFSVLAAQLDWLEQQLRAAAAEGQKAVLLLHCYPTDLKQGGERLRELVRRGSVALIDMGHTHYNEVANDGRTLYTATRSTGQIEEGPVGFSITNIDGDAVSWKFITLGETPVAMITTPADERFITERSLNASVVEGNRIEVRVKVWGSSVRSVVAALEDRRVALIRVAESNVWEGQLERGCLPDGVYRLTARAEDEVGRVAEDAIRIVVGLAAYKAPRRAARDQDNALESWPERGLLGTQLGPNKHGRQW